MLVILSFSTTSLGSPDIVFLLLLMLSNMTEYFTNIMLYYRLFCCRPHFSSRLPSSSPRCRVDLIPTVTSQARVVRRCVLSTCKPVTMSCKPSGITSSSSVWMELSRWCSWTHQVRYYLFNSLGYMTEYFTIFFLIINYDYSPLSYMTEYFTIFYSNN